MYLLTPKTDDCRQFFQYNIPPELRLDDRVCIDFKSFHEIVEALRIEGLEPDRDYIIE